MNDTFGKFTPRARMVLSLVQEEAQRFNHNYIGTEHLLLGLIREGDGVAARVLANCGVSLGEVRESVERIIGRGDRIVLGEIGLTPRAKKVIELAVGEARHLNHPYIGTEHLLLGIVREGEGIAANILRLQGLTLDYVRTQTIEMLTQSRPFHATESPPQPSPHGVTFTYSPREGGSFSVSGLEESARHVLILAYAEAQHLHQKTIGDAQILLGLVLEGSSSAAQALDQHGATVIALRRALEGIKVAEDALPEWTDITLLAQLAQQVLRHARVESERRGTHLVTPAHLLLGLLATRQGAAVAALRQLDVDLEALYAEVAQHLHGDTQPDQPPE